MKIKDLEDKLARTLRRNGKSKKKVMKKEKDDAFEYGGFSFCKRNL